MSNVALQERQTLESVRQRFELWRNQRSKLEPIPKPLWNAAVKLCRNYPISKVCQHLRLAYSALKKRIPPLNDSKIRFMELDLRERETWQLEMERSDGAKLRLSFNGKPPAAAHLIEAFFS